MNMLLMTEMFSVPEHDLDPGQSVNSGDKRRQETMRALQSRNNVQWNCCRVLITNIQLTFPKRCLCGCFKLTKRDRIFMRGYKSLEKEIHVVYILK